MSLLRSLFPGLRSLFRKEQVNKELDEELNGFLEMAAEEKMKQGMSRREALRAVRLERGSLEVTKEVVRSAGWESFVETCWQDVRFGLRTLRKSPGFTTIAILTLALGIGANTAIFTMTNGLMLRTLSVQDPGRLVELLHQYPGEPAFNGFSWDAYQTIRDGNHVFSDLIVGGMNFLTIRGDKLQPQTVFGGGVGGTFFQVLGVRPAAGRLISHEDVHMGYHDPVAVVSWSFWKSRFDLDPGVIGKKIIVGDDAVTIVGVAQRGFYGLADLCAREKTKEKRMGCCFADGSHRQGRDANSIDVIFQWTKDKSIDVVLWTDLPGSFDDVPKQDFLNAAVNYVQQLPPEGKAMAAEYVWRAPTFVVTPLRNTLQAEPWFRKS